MYNKRGKKDTDHPDDPLNRKHLKKVNPMGEEVNNTGVPLDITDGDEGNLDGLGMNSIKVDAKPKRVARGLDPDDIGLYEESGDQLIPNRATK